MRAERIGAYPYGRTSYEIDAINARVEPDSVEKILEDESTTAPLAVIRIVTTTNRLYELTGGFPAEGDWLELELVPRADRQPIAYHAQLREDGYTLQSRGKLASCRILSTVVDRGPPPRSAGAAASHSVQLAHALAVACNFPVSAVRTSSQIRERLKRVGRPHRLLVRDVGQASFVTLLSDAGRPLLHIDAGWPIVFNGRTAPKRFSQNFGKAPVLLSHWDFDHLLGVYRFPELRDCHWITPVQPLGPGARRISHILNSKSRLHGYRGSTIHTQSGRLMQANGPNPMNDTGLVFEASLTSGRTALCVGDASYTSIQGTQPVDFLVMTHHGANFDGVAVRARSKGSDCVVSVGRGNVYQHPRYRALSTHMRAGWKLRFTKATSRARRGNRHLGP